MVSRDFAGARASGRGGRLFVCSVLLLSVLPCLGASLRIESTPARATAFVDGVFVGVTPVTVPAVTVGPHAVRLMRAGCQMWLQKVEVPDAGTVVQATLTEEGRGRLEVTTTPSGADVYVNGDLRGKSPLILDDLPLGTLRVRLQHSDYEPWEGDVVLAGDMTKLDRALQSRTIEYYRQEIKTHPEQVVNYTELGHNLFLLHKYDEGLQVLDQGTKEAGAPTADLEEVRRLYDELDKIYQGQYDYGGDQAVAKVQPLLVKMLEAAIKASPDNGYNYRALGSIYRQENDFARSLDLYEQALKRVKDPIVKSMLEYEVATALLQTAKQDGKKSDPNAEIATLRQVVDRFPTSDLAPTALARIIVIDESRLRNDDLAAQARREYVDKFPKDDNTPRQLFELAQRLDSRLKRYDDAQAAYRELVQHYPHSRYAPSAMSGIASLYLKLKQSDAAIAAYQDLLKQYPHSDLGSYALQQMAALYGSRGDNAEQKQCQNELRQRFPLSQAAFYLDHTRDAVRRRVAVYQEYKDANTLTSKKQYHEAVAALQTFRQQHPDCCWAVSALIQISSIDEYRLHDADAARAAREQFIKDYPNDDQCPDMRFAIATSLYRDKRYDDAVAEYRTFMEAYPDDDRAPLAAYYLTFNFVRQGQYHEAIDAAQQAIVRYPDSNYVPGMRLAIGNAYRELDDLPHARETFEKIIHDYPGHSAAYGAYNGLLRLM